MLKGAGKDWIVKRRLDRFKGVSRKLIKEELKWRNSGVVRRKTKTSRRSSRGFVYSRFTRRVTVNNSEFDHLNVKSDNHNFLSEMCFSIWSSVWMPLDPWQLLWPPPFAIEGIYLYYTRCWPYQRKRGEKRGVASREQSRDRATWWLISPFSSEWRLSSRVSSGHPLDINKRRKNDRVQTPAEEVLVVSSPSHHQINAWSRTLCLSSTAAGSRVIWEEMQENKFNYHKKSSTSPDLGQGTEVIHSVQGDQVGSVGAWCMPPTSGIST